MSSAIERKKQQRALERWIVVEAAGFQFAFPLEELDAVIEIHSSRIKRTQGRRRPGYLGKADWAGNEREIRSLAEQLDLNSRVLESYPTIVTRPPATEPGGDEPEPVFWAVERVAGSYEQEQVNPEPVPPEWWSTWPIPFRAVWWRDNQPVWVIGTAELINRWNLRETEAGSGKL